MDGLWRWMDGFVVKGIDESDVWRNEPQLGSSIDTCNDVSREKLRPSQIFTSCLAKILQTSQVPRLFPILLFLSLQVDIVYLNFSPPSPSGGSDNHSLPKIDRWGRILAEKNHTSRANLLLL